MSWSTESAGPKPAQQGAPKGRGAEHLDMGIGFLGFWGIVLLITVVWLELTGGPALGWALLLAAVVIIMALLLRFRAKLQRKSRN